MKRIRLALVLLVALGGVACAKDKPNDLSASGSAGANASVSVEEFCENSDLDARMDALDNVNPQDPAAFGEAFAEVIEIMEEATAIAPAEIRADMEEGLALFVELNTELSAVDYDFTKLSQDTVARFQEIGTELQEFGETMESLCGGE